jgi:hypothetical protein
MVTRKALPSEQEYERGDDRDRDERQEPGLAPGGPEAATVTVLSKQR